MVWHVVGEFFLNVSTVIYLFWLIPQLVLNFRGHSVAAISLSMHVCLCLGYISDFAYGFGLGLPWQYKLVSILGFVMILVQHSQFIFYKSWSSWQRLGFYALSIILVTLCVAAFYYSVIRQCSPGFYNAVGLFSLGCWMLYAWPQVIKNFSTRTSKGISLSTVGLSIIMSIGDLIAAYALDWPWPSKIGALLAIVPKLILLWQCFYYNLSREVLNVA